MLFAPVLVLFLKLFALLVCCNSPQQYDMQSIRRFDIIARQSLYAFRLIGLLRC